jgi:acyl-CoA hydrolase
MVTKKITEVVFNKPVRPGQIIKIYGTVLRVGTRSITIRLEARRHSVYNGSQRIVLSTDMTFVRVDGDGEAIPISDKVRIKYNKASEEGEKIEEPDLYEVYGGD